MARPATTKVPVYCYQCVAGPDLLKVEVADDVALRVSPNLDICNEHPGGGRVCVKAFGLVQKTYNPNRVRQPMRRTNPRKGRNEDPGFVPISWDEALDAIAAKLREIRAKGLRDEAGYPRVAASFGGGGTPTQYMGTFPALLAAWGPVDTGIGSGQGIKCYHSEHLYGELWHRAFIVSPDTPRCRYIIGCGVNTDASGGVAGVWRHADARARGVRRIQVEPHLSIAGALAGEWLPIKPKTDAAFLYGLIHRIIHERDWRAVCDVPFLERDTNSPYLIGPHGYYLRDPVSEKPLVWDEESGCAKRFDETVAHPALAGTFRTAGLEIGADGERWQHDSCEAKPAFQMLRDHMAGYTPDWAESQCEIAAATIRRIADEYLDAASVGATIEIGGQTLPYRPVAVVLGKTVNNGWGGYQSVWARTVLACLVGALEVPGGLLGTNVKINRPANNRLQSVKPGEDGFMDFPFNETSKEGWQGKPDIRNAYRTLVPLAGHSPWSPALGPAHLPWLFQRKPPANWTAPTKPELWFVYRTNPAISSWATSDVADTMATFPFVVAFAYTRDETNHMADILLPEATDLEGLQLIQIGGTKFIEQFWKHEGWAVRQPVAQPPVDCRDMTDIATAIAERAGILREYNDAINRGAAGMRLKTDRFDYSLDPNTAHGRDAIWDCIARAASHDLSNGARVHGIDWFKQHGFMLRPFPELEWFLYPRVKELGLRFEQPYQERIKRHGAQLANRLHEIGVTWWDKQLEEYEPLPHYQPFPDIWTNYAREVGRDPAEFPFWALTARSMQYAWGANVGIPLINEVAQNVAGHRGVIMNRGAARELGIAEGDPIEIESVAGKTRGHAVLREGVRPDTIVMIGQFDHWVTPFAKSFQLASLNSVAPMALSLTDATGSGADVVRVRITRVADAVRRAL